MDDTSGFFYSLGCSIGWSTFLKNAEVSLFKRPNIGFFSDSFEFEKIDDWKEALLWGLNAGKLIDWEFFSFYVSVFFSIFLPIGSFWLKKEVDRLFLIIELYWLCLFFYWVYKKSLAFSTSNLRAFSSKNLILSSFL